MGSLGGRIVKRGIQSTLCRRHRIPSSWQEHGQRFCLRCFREAMMEAEVVDLSEIIRRLTHHA